MAALRFDESGLSLLAGGADGSLVVYACVDPGSAAAPVLCQLEVRTASHGARARLYSHAFLE